MRLITHEFILVSELWIYSGSGKKTFIAEIHFDVRIDFFF